MVLGRRGKKERTRLRQAGVIGPDGFHPTSMGYRRIGEIFFSEIVNRHDVTPRAPSAAPVR